ncbi:GH25 family lysozyme [Lactobacillus helveticus]|uniref:GH25 family lysozyme n=1 Tax=Lactobacillus helveticus TaxID=1587 RepID=UPI0021823276|nr:GH25 family lysozyme [Lactobacillus helveticus]MCS8612213.1 lysozyme [Lactobacillus helveticus]MCT3410311.1 lysozyme [Lactobacillus helveticus]
MKRYHHKYTLPAILTLLILAIAFLLIGFFNFKRQTTLPPDSNSSPIGIELNQDVDYVNLHKLQSNGISFVYLKSTQGRSYFDENYLSYRDQILGTQLAFGSEILYSNESTARQHYRYFFNQVGNNTGSLPILIVPVAGPSKKYLQSMSKFTRMLQQRGKTVMVELDQKYRRYFNQAILFMSTGKKAPNKLKYLFWRYTTNGRVKDVSDLEKGITMYAYNGTVGQYKQKYGQLTQ